MRTIKSNILLLILFALVSCNDNFLDITPKDFVTDDAVWSSGTATKMFINDIYNQTLTGPLYRYTSFGGSYHFDYFCTDDMGESRVNWNGFNFTAANCPMNTWSDNYINIRKTNIGIEKLGESLILSDVEKNRFLGDLHFLRGLLYLNLFRFYGGVPIITESLNRDEDDIFYARSSADETLKFIIDEFQLASEKLPLTLDAKEYGRATKGAALGMKAVAYLHGAGTVNSKYYTDAATTANEFINGNLRGLYELFGAKESDPQKKQQAFINLFLEPYDGNKEVIFDVQYAYPYRTQGGYQTIAAPGAPGPGHAYGWGRSAPSQNLVDAFEMKDGSEFDWNNPEHVAHPYENRDARLYGTVLYHGEAWKGGVLSLSSNRFDNGVEVSNNLPNGLFSTKSESTQTGYFIRKHQNESVICGATNRSGLGDGGNVIVLRYAEILLTYAEAKNEVSGPDASVYDAINQIRSRAGQPNLPAGLSKAEMREKIHKERRVELAFECKRFFDIIRWKEGEKYLDVPLMGMNARYAKDPASGKIALNYSKFKVFDGNFSAPKNYLLPIPQSAIDRNPKLEQNPGW